MSRQPTVKLRVEKCKTLNYFILVMSSILQISSSYYANDNAPSNDRREAEAIIVGMFCYEGIIFHNIQPLLILCLKINIYQCRYPKSIDLLYMSSCEGYYQ